MLDHGLCAYIFLLLASACCVAAEDSAEVKVLAQTIWGEARGEGKEGMEAVASVIINRADYPSKGQLWWGRTIEEVCKKRLQFECWNKGNPNRPLMESVTESDLQFRMALEIARKAVARQLPDRTNGATHFYAYQKIAPPKWTDGRTPSKQIRGHKLYKIGPFAGSGKKELR